MPDIGLLGGPPRPRIVLAPPPEFELLHDPSSAASDIVIENVSVVVSASAAAASAAPEAPAASASAGTQGRAPTRIPAGAVPPPIRARDLLWLAFALFVIIGTGLGMRDPWPADEPRFAAVARDMVLSGEWLFPRVGGDLYQDKPPLFFWMLAVCYSLTGSVKASFLVPSLCAAGGVLFLIYDLGRRLVSRAAGFAAALLVLCSLQFVMTMRGAQIDPMLCFFTTLSLYALLRHLLLGPAWRWYFIGGFAAGLGIITKGVGFLPMLLLIPFFLMRGFKWQGLAPLDAGKGGWRWWLAPLAMLVAVSLWFVPMLLAVAANGGEYVAYRDEILFKQTVGRYAASWHHVKGWYYFIAEVVPLLWLPWSILLFWLVPRFKSAWTAGDARVWLPLSWMLIVLLFFSLSPGKRGVYVLPALPALAIASLPFLEALLARAGVRRVGFILGAGFFLAAAVLAVGYIAHAKFAVEAITAANLDSATMLYVYLALCGAGLVYAWKRAPLIAWPAALGALAIVFSYFLAPAMNSERSASGFMRAMLAQVKPREELALVAYKEQFLLYIDRPIVNFGHRRWLEGPQENYDAAAWLNAAPNRVLLVPADTLKKDAEGCFVGASAADTTMAGTSSSEEWYIYRGKAAPECAEKGDAARAIYYDLESEI